MNQTKVLSSGWTSDHDRPVYFVELRDGYACAWCELMRGWLRLVPHPASGREIRQFEHPREAEVIGRVTHVAMRIAPNANKYNKVRNAEGRPV